MEATIATQNAQSIDITVQWDPETLVDQNGWEGINYEKTVSEYERLWRKAFLDADAEKSYNIIFERTSSSIGWEITGMKLEDDADFRDYESLMSAGQYGGEEIFSNGNFWVDDDSGRGGKDT